MNFLGYIKHAIILGCMKTLLFLSLTQIRKVHFPSKYILNHGLSTHSGCLQKLETMIQLLTSERQTPPGNERQWLIPAPVAICSLNFNTPAPWKHTSNVCCLPTHVYRQYVRVPKKVGSATPDQGFQGEHLDGRQLDRASQVPPE